MNAHQTPTAAYQTITPEIAGEWLSKYNTRNRPLCKRRVAEAAEKIKTGRHIACGDTIRFDANGTLIDGQHRLAAIVRSGVQLTELVVHGLPPEAFAVIDTGKRRSVADSLRIEKVPYGARMASALKVLRALASAKQGDALIPLLREGMDAQQARKELTRWPDLPATMAYGYTVKTRFPAVQEALVGAMVTITDRDGYAESRRWWESFATGSGLVEGSPALALRNKFIERRAGSGFRRNGNEDMALRVILILRAWDAHVSGRSVKFIRAGEDGTLPRIPGQ